MLGRRIGRYWIRRGRFQEYINLDNPRIIVETGTAYPYILFRLEIDSNLWLDLTIEKLVADIYMASSNMGTKIFERVQLQRHIIEESSSISFVDEPVADEVKDIKKFKSEWITLLFAPPKDALKSQYVNNWTMRGVIIFSCRLGVVNKQLALNFSVEQNDLNRLRGFCSVASCFRWLFQNGWFGFIYLKRTQIMVLLTLREVSKFSRR